MLMKVSMRYGELKLFDDSNRIEEGSLRQYRNLEPSGNTSQVSSNIQSAKNGLWGSAIGRAIQSVVAKNVKRPTMCFLCVQNERLKTHERVHVAIICVSYVSRFSPNALWISSLRVIAGRPTGPSLTAVHRRYTYALTTRD